MLDYLHVVLIFIIIINVLADDNDIDYDDESINCPLFSWYGPWYFDILPYIDSFEHVHLTNGDLGTKATDHEVPIILWWTGFTGEPGRVKRCGDVKCFFTIHRKYKKHERTKAFMFYGTDFSTWDIPLPADNKHVWALLHEESPKNNYLFSHSEIMEMFNLTSTFRRESDMPLTTQHLESIEVLASKKYLVPTAVKSQYIKDEGLALVCYIQSDCNTPSDRDHFIEMLQRYFKVDSYGACKHNKDLPPHLKDPVSGMDDQDFYKLVAKYKFTITIENAICPDYITEKVWRPFIVGSVPIILGSPSIKEFLPSNQSAILVEDYDSIEDIVKLVQFLDQNDAEYEKYLDFKTNKVSNKYLIDTLSRRPFSVGKDYSKPNFVDAFECHVCRKVHNNVHRTAKGKPEITYRAKEDHYGCPKPKRFSDIPSGNITRIESDWWSSEWVAAKFEAIVLKQFLREGKIVTKEAIQSEAESRLLDYFNRNNGAT